MVFHTPGVAGSAITANTVVRKKSKKQYSLVIMLQNYE
jgi:hypothetical protein